MADKRDGKKDRLGDRVVEQIQFDLIFAATFIVVLAGAFVMLLLPWTWPRRISSDDKRWFFGRAWDDTATFIELAYMG